MNSVVAVSSNLPAQGPAGVSCLTPNDARASLSLRPIRAVAQNGRNDFKPARVTEAAEDKCRIAAYVPIGVRQPRFDLRENTGIANRDQVLGNVQLSPECFLSFKLLNQIGWRILLGTRRNMLQGQNRGNQHEPRDSESATCRRANEPGPSHRPIVFSTGSRRKAGWLENGAASGKETGTAQMPAANVMDRPRGCFSWHWDRGTRRRRLSSIPKVNCRAPAREDEAIKSYIAL
jgi:hypothetical protein